MNRLRRIKITDVKVMLVRAGLGWPFCKIETDSGISGIGEACHGYGIQEIILKQLKPMLIGENPLDIDRLYTKMVKGSAVTGSTMGIKMYAISGLEIALWDLAGKVFNAPVYQLLGGKYRDGVPAYLTTSPGDMLDPSACREFADWLKNHPYGFKAVKCGWVARQDIDDIRIPWTNESGPFQALRPGPISRRFTRKDLSRAAKGFENLRAALGDDIEIAVHCHWEFDWADALALARAVAPINPWWLEDPMPPDYADSWVRLTAESPVPIMMGENLYTRRGFTSFLVNQGCHMIHPDFLRAGGLLESKKIADFADNFYIPTGAHNMASPLGLVASAHAAISIRNFIGHECNFASLAQDLEKWESFVHTEKPIIEDGLIKVSDKPGLGIELNEDVVRAHLDSQSEWWGNGSR